MAMIYRRDIDGLRSVAIIPVLVFHAGVRAFGGGFVGVDVFFVISGYLITKILINEIADGNFSLARFYERRIRRIAPALIAVLLFVYVMIILIFMPSDTETAFKSIVAATLFSSNMFFWKSTGYFDSTANVKPLLHTWSLAVEEQFYLFFPLFLALAAKIAPGGRNAMITGIVISSFGASLVLTHVAPSFAFYMILTRAWELGIGSLLAAGAIPETNHPRLREALAVAGLASIVLTVFLLDEAVPFPGLAAAPPVLGAAALIQYAPGTFVGRILSTRAAVGVGLVSYSLYLWHWPIIVFWNYFAPGSETPFGVVTTIVLSFVMAGFSWRFIEQPFRSRTRFDARFMFRSAALAGGAIVALAVVGIVGHGWPQRFSPQVLAMDRGSTDISPYRGTCHHGEAELPQASPVPCTLGAAVAPSALVWGDSHGVELSFVLSQAAAAGGRSIVQQTDSACTPLIGRQASQNARCTMHNRMVFDYIHAHPNIRTVVLVSYWMGEQNRKLAGLPAALAETVTALERDGRRVVFVSGVPPQVSDVPHGLAMAALRGDVRAFPGAERSDAVRRMDYLIPTVRRLQAAGMQVVDPLPLLCPGPQCDVVRNGQPLYFDSHHLSVAGARIIAPAVAGAIWPDQAATR